MNISIIILGMIQGLTEFLPISSSGHLLLTKKILSVELPLIFDILLHIATMFAVIVFTYPMLKSMIQSSMRLLFKKSTNITADKQQIKIIIFLIISTLATAPIGLILKSTVVNSTIFSTSMSMYFTALMLVLPFLIPSIAHKIKISLHSNHPRSLESTISLTQVILLGIAQGFAVLPGISRSGITISIGVLCGLSYAHATKYSFLMAIPAILASFVLSMGDISDVLHQINISTLLLGLLSAFIFGIIGLKGLSLIANKGKIWIFSIYLIIIATIGILLA